MDQPGRLVLFSDVVDCGRFRRAAGLYGTNVSAISRQVEKLEASLGVRLLERSPRGLVLTEAGEALYPHACRIRATLRASEQIGEHFRGGVRGVLHISAARHLGRRNLLPLVAAFRDQHPEVHVDLRLEDRFIDIVGEGVDLAIRVTHPEDTSLACRKLADTPLVVVAAPSLLARLGQPGSMESLADYPAITYRGEQTRIDYWPYRTADGTTRTVGVQPVLTLNDGDGMADAARRGLGVALLARYTVAQELANGDLVDVFPETDLPPFAPVYALFPSGPLLPGKTRAFLDFAKANPELAGW